MSDDHAAAPTGAGGREIFGHPRGLLVLAATDLWDRISFYGMQSLLVLYLVDQLLRPGHVEHIIGFTAFRAGLEHVTGPLSTQALATQIFGLYVGMVALGSVFGGLIGDRWLGRRGSIALGALLMTAGHFCMAFDASFLAAMALLILGAGLLRGNILPQFGELYARDDRRRDVAFQVYGSMVNLGAFIAPLLTGALGQAYGWHVAFGFAGVGMLTGLIVYVSGQKLLPQARPRGRHIPRERLDRDGWKMVGFLVLLTPVGAGFWVAQSQVWNTYNLWVRDHVELRFGSWTMPVPWLQSLDGLAPFILLPPMLWLWAWQRARDREPDEFVKTAIGCFIFSASTLWLAAAGFVTDAHGRTPLIWPVMFHLISNLGWLYFSPPFYALYSRLAPRSVNATLIGVGTAAVTIGSFISGRLGGLYETLTAGQFWTLHAAIVGTGGVALLAMGAWARRLFPAQA
ncbi:peptide MFS transporter [Phenylobacterium aquaticum]|uniref:peptide MFS transporter n=1 Tax=Phenylobacterium aquaticum TaxID=1763816 RepID=UPI0026EB6B56|nr:peptide MFS transporter [Phenylobacterium aquaticum]